MKLTNKISYFSLQYFTFLRKCAFIRRELHLMGYTNTKVQIRNLPIGSDNYYICYSFSGYAQAVTVERDRIGNIIAVHDKLFYDRFQEDVDNYISAQTDPEDVMFGLDHTYPTALLNPLDIYAFSDEKIGFTLTKNYLSKVKKAQAALKELENEEGKIFLDHHLVQQWVDKHHDFYWSIQLDWNMKKLSDFQLRFFYMHWLVKDIAFFPRIHKALLEYKPLDEDWYWRAAELGGTYYGCDMWLFEVFDEKPFMLKQIDREFYLYGEVYQSIFTFTEMYKREKGYFNPDETKF
jgi:hypothetical protein